MTEQSATTGADGTNDKRRYEFIQYEHRDHVVWTTLNRPEVLNAIHPPLNAELDDAWQRFQNDPEAWVMVVTGAGDRAFSAGADLKWRAQQGDALRESEESSRTVRRGRDCWKPVIAAVNGYAVGGGLELAMSCDIILAAEHAQFGLPEPRRGLVADAGGVHKLVRRIPLNVAMGLIVTGKFITAQEAYRIGLVNEVVPATDLRAAAERWAQEVVTCSPLAVQASKQMALEGLEGSLWEAVDREYSMFDSLRQSDDFVEGARAFAEKRHPDWKGR